MKKNKNNQAVSIQIGFVLNTAILVTFITIILVVIGGGFGDSLSTQEELEIVADSVEAKLIEADSIAVTSDSFTAFFEPPSSGAQYKVEINSGIMTVTSPEDIDAEVRRSVEGTTVEVENIEGDIEFTQQDTNVIMEYSDNTGTLELDVQSGPTVQD